jgi:hypothetical protein
VRSALFAALLLISGCRCGPDTSPVDEQPLRVSPSALDFGSVYAGATKSLTVDVVNPNAVALSVSAAAPPPFTAAGFEVGQGSDFVETVTFAPTAPGMFNGVIMLGDAGVTVSGVGLAVPPCLPSDDCHRARFDLDAGQCLESAVPDGTDCTASLACFLKAQCAGGTCYGTLTTCDDGDPCTTDVCGTTGCGHVDGVFACPGSTNPCLAPACDHDAGCGLVPVPDGTSCGARDCQTAQVCINAACVSRAVPQTQGCTEVLAGNPEGSGFADGVGRNARFGYFNAFIAVDAARTVWIIDAPNNELRKVTPAGEVVTVAGHRRPGLSPLADGFGSSAVLPGPGNLTVDTLGTIVFADVTTLRRSSPAGLVTTWLGAPDALSGIADGIGSAAGIGTVRSIAAGAAGEIFTLEQNDSAGPLFVRHVSADGEITTLHSLNVNGTWVDLAWTNGALFVSTEGTGVQRDVGGVLSPFWPGSGIEHIAASPAGEVAVAVAYALFVIGPDGGTESTWTEPGETIGDVAYYAPGRWALALYESSKLTTRIGIVSDAGVTLLAGPDWPLRYQDGPATTSGLSQPSGITVGPQGDIFVAEPTSVRRISNGNLSTWWSDTSSYLTDLATLADGGLLAAGQNDLYVISGFDAGAVFTAAHCWGLDVRGDLVAAACQDGVHLWDDRGNDAGLVPAVDQDLDLAFNDNGGIYLLNGSSVDDLELDGGRTTVAPLPVIFPSTHSIAHVPGGDFFVTEQSTLSIFRVTSAGNVSTVATLSDPPSGITVEDAGTLLVTVPDAVLRVHP